MQSDENADDAKSQLATYLEKAESIRKMRPGHARRIAEAIWIVRPSRDSINRSAKLLKTMYKNHKSDWLAEIPDLIKDGSDSSVDRLRLLCHIDQKDAWPKSADAIIQIAENATAAGDLQRGKKNRPSHFQQFVSGQRPSPR